MRAPFSVNTHQVTKKKTAHNQAARGTFALCATSAFRLTTVRPRRLVALSRSPDADLHLYRVTRREWHESSERNQSTFM